MLALGTWLFGRKGWQANLSQAAISHLVELAVDQGIEIIDTAPIYGQGKAEELLSAPLKFVRQKVTLVTKCGLLWDARGHIHKDHSAKTILQDIQHSLKRLQVSAVDILLVHWPDGHTPLEDTCEGLNSVLKKGYAHRIGLSNWSLAEISQAKKLAPITVLQEPCNLAQPPSASYLATAKQHDLWLMGYSPLAQGLLTGKYSTPPKLPKHDFRNFNSLFFEPHFSQINKLNAQLTTLLPEVALSLTDLALQYVQSICHCAVVGVRHEKQLKEVLLSNHKTLPISILKTIQDIQTALGLVKDLETL